jgi:hypothetical protein
MTCTQFFFNMFRDYVVPGERVQIKGAADPGSLLFLGAVDRSISFLSDKDTRVSASRIYSALKDQVSSVPWSPAHFHVFFSLIVP